MRKIQRAVVVVFFLASLALAAAAFAGKPSGSGGGGSSTGAYAPTLSTSLQSLAAPNSSTSGEGTSYTISGCGYDAAYGMVTVEVFTPVGVGWVAENPDPSGCIAVYNFSTVGHGSYKIDAWQHVKNKDQVVAETTFTW
jgi:hypothetical protein